MKPPAAPRSGPTTGRCWPRGVRLGAALVVVVLAAAGVSRAAQSVGRRPASTPAVAAAAFGGTDTAWLQLMIPMTTQAVLLLDLTASRATAAVAGLAARLVADYRGDLLRLRATLARAGLSPTNEHNGHDLPGMITAADLGAIGRRTGADFDALAVRHLREEMAQSVRLARSERQAGRNGDCRTLAASIDTARTTALDRLNAVLGP
jgi:uncharacterized protein (DUF305 family)